MRSRSDAGFSLVEVVIAMFVLGLIAVMLLPALITGIRTSADQSAVATATRRLSAIVEEGRQNPSCSGLEQVRDENAGFTDGAGRTFDVAVKIVDVGDINVVNDDVEGCDPSTDLVELKLTASQGGTVLATLDAVIFAKKSS